MKRIVACVLWLLCASPAPAALSILHTTHSSILSSASATVIYSTTPTAGNLLVLFLGTTNTGTVTPPSGWTTLDVQSAGGTALLYSFYHVVGTGETNSYTFTSATARDQWEFVGYEVTGQAASAFIDQHGATGVSAASVTTPSLTPSVLGDLVLSAASPVFSSRTLTSVSGGWTNDVSQTGTFHPTWGASRDSLTSDTTTPVTNTFTINSSDALTAAVVFVAPGATAATASQLPLLGVGH